MKAFTLIEILVVVAIISILAAILFPVLSRAKEASHIAVCTSNLRQIAVAELEYGADNNGNFNARIQGGFNTTYLLSIGPYCKDAAKLMCPDDPIAGTVFGRIGGPNGPPLFNYTGYAMNGCTPAEAAIRSSAKIVFFTDVAEVRQVLPLLPPGWQYGNDGIGAPFSFLLAPDVVQMDSPMYKVAGQWGALRHFGKGNYAMADGHVRLFPVSQVAYYPNRNCHYHVNYNLVNPNASISFPNIQ